MLNYQVIRRRMSPFGRARKRDFLVGIHFELPPSENGVDLGGFGAFG